MKLHQDSNATLNMITAYSESFLEVNRQRYDHSIVLWPEGPVLRWEPKSFDQISANSLSGLAEQLPEVILLGTGAKQRFLHPSIGAHLSAKFIGLEAMNTAAACRTYNILVSEGRKVVALLLPAL
jgi:uncharacterized protein